jgi:hypothetical protein
VDGSVGKSGVGVSVAARHALNNRLTIISMLIKKRRDEFGIRIFLLS